MKKTDTLLSRIRDSLWFIPGVLTLLGALLAVATVWLDGTLLQTGRVRTHWLVFGVGAEGARGVLASIAAGLVTVTGVVFSVTVVALQLASSQFTPRVLRTFTRDRANQWVLGVFIATFTYALLVLRTVRSATRGAAAFVPSISVTVAVGLALASIGFLIFFIDHIARSIRAERILESVTRQTQDSIERVFPEWLEEGEDDDGEGEAAEGDLTPDAGGRNGAEDGGAPRDSGAAARPAPQGWAVLRAERPGYLQVIDEPAILKEAARDGLEVRTLVRVGAFVLPGEPIAAVGPGGKPPDDDRDRTLREAFVLGPERTAEDDVELGLGELSDIAVRALSPSNSDPTTAAACIDRLGELLVELGRRRVGPQVRSGKDGRGRLVLRRASFRRLVRLAYMQVRHHGAGDPTVAAHLLASMGKVAALVPPGRRPPVRDEAAHALAAASRTARGPDLARLARAAAWLDRDAAATAPPAVASPGSSAGTPARPPPPR